MIAPRMNRLTAAPPPPRQDDRSPIHQPPLFPSAASAVEHMIDCAGKFNDKENAGDDESQLQAATSTASIVSRMMMPVMIHSNRSI